VISKDLLSPVVMGPADAEIYEGETLSFTDMGSYDNVGVTDWVWEVSTPSGDEDVFAAKDLTYFFELPGEYNISFTVFDSAGNNDTMFFLVKALEKGEGFDQDDDGLPDEWEDENGLDKRVNDANRDPDGDLLTNKQEFQIGTDPNDPDTDGDGLPDNYEYNFRKYLDPLTPGDQDEDPDGDGDTNLEEYLDGARIRDPTISDAEEEEEDNTVLILVLAIVAALIILLVMIAVVIFGGKKRELDEDFPEEQFPHLHKKE
jgi:hypothetical protein